VTTNMRFRVYDEKKKTKLTVLSDFAQTLHRYRLNFSTSLIIETKGDHE
jgi:hypothetical protein